MRQSPIGSLFNVRREQARYKDANHAGITLLYLDQLIQKKLQIETATPIIKRHIPKKTKSLQKYDFEIETQQRHYMVGVLRVLALANESTNKILNHPQLAMYNFRIIEGADTRAGLRKQKDLYKLAITDGNWEEQPKWNSYENFHENFEWGKREEYRSRKEEFPQGPCVDRIVLEGKDDPAISSLRIVIEIGKKIIPREKRFSLSRKNSWLRLEV